MIIRDGLRFAWSAWVGSDHPIQRQLAG